MYNVKRDFVKLKDKHDYIKKQHNKLKNRNIKEELELKIKEVGATKISQEKISDLESETKNLKEKNCRLLKKINEVLQQRERLRFEIEDLKMRLGEPVCDSESETD